MTLFTDLRLHEVANLESYDVELDESLFSTAIPEGYTELKLPDIIAGKLALAGLGILPVGGIAWTWRRRRKIRRAPMSDDLPLPDGLGTQALPTGRAFFCAEPRRRVSKTDAVD